VTTGSGTQLQISARHVVGRRRAYGVWLYSDPGRRRFLGLSVATALWPDHTLVGGAILPGNYRSYRKLLITAEPDRKPTAPGKIVLEGSIPH
jgi:hypothetical protein